METADTAKVRPKFVCCREATGGQGVHREVESEGLAEKYRAAIEGASPAGRLLRPDTEEASNKAE